jgi:transcription elongation GreA/GreB family factor
MDELFSFDVMPASRIHAGPVAGRRIAAPGSLDNAAFPGDVRVISEQPRVVLPQSHQKPLKRLVAEAFRDGHRLAPFLSAEIRRAIFCDDALVPDDVVVPGCKVSYRLNWQEIMPYRLLTYPQDFHDEAAQISLLSPIGVALLGLRAGDGMPVFIPEHGFQTLRVVGVEHPERSVTGQVAAVTPG